MKEPVFTGSGVAIITPMLPDSTVNFEKLDELIEFQLSSGTDAIIICGTTGEAATLTDDEQLSLIAHAVKTVNHRCKVIAGTGSNCTAHSIELSQAAALLGADALLVVTPYYNKATPSGLLQHYSSIADSVCIPLIAYNVPSRTGVSMTAELYQELSRHPNINGVKEASGDLSLAARAIAACGSDFYLWSGNDDQTVPMMVIGAKGVISVMANLCPSATSEMTHCCLSGDFTTAGQMQVNYASLMDALFLEVNPIPIKTAMNLAGFDVGSVRLPLCEMQRTNYVRLENTLKSYHLIA